MQEEWEESGCGIQGRVEGSVVPDGRPPQACSPPPSPPPTCILGRLPAIADFQWIERYPEVDLAKESCGVASLSGIGYRKSGMMGGVCALRQDRLNSTGAFSVVYPTAHDSPPPCILRDIESLPVVSAFTLLCGVCSRNEHVEANFGAKPFVFDLDALVHQQRLQQESAVQRFSPTATLTHPSCLHT
jgi:hypothetical protein